MHDAPGLGAVQRGYSAMQVSAVRWTRRAKSRHIARFLSFLIVGSPRVATSPAIRLGVDIGGTFTDVALEIGDRRYTAKGLTTTRGLPTIRKLKNRAICRLFALLVHRTAETCIAE